MVEEKVEDINDKGNRKYLEGLIAAQVSQKLKEEREDQQAKYQEVIRESNDNRNRNFFMNPEVIQVEMLVELRKIRKLLERKP